MIWWRKMLEFILIPLLYIFSFNNYLGYPSFADMFNGLTEACVIFTALFLIINGLAIGYYRHWNQVWKGATVLILSSIPYFCWFYVYPWTAWRTYPVFIHYLAAQGKSTQDIREYRAFPDLKFGGYSYNVRFKGDTKYDYAYTFKNGQEMFFDVSSDGEYGDYKDAAVKQIFTEEEYRRRATILSKKDAEDFRKNGSMLPVAEKLRREKLKESRAHPVKVFQSLAFAP